MLREIYATHKRVNYCYQYPHPAVTTDCVIFGFDGTRLNVLLIARGIEPYKGRWAFPGGFIRMEETAEECARRELREEAGLEAAYMRQFHTFSTLDRDPRERVITIAYYALVQLRDVVGGDDAARAQWFPLDDVPRLAFDHDAILRQAIAELRRQIHFEPIGFELLPPQFTMTQLQRLYEAVLGVKFDRRNFYNKMRHLGLLGESGETVTMPNRREAFLYSFNRESYDELKERGFRLEF